MLLFTLITSGMRPIERLQYNAILVTAILCYRYSTINNFAKNKIFQQNLVIVSAIYLG